MIIEKVASQNKYRRNIVFFDRARDGFKNWLENLKETSEDVVLLPAYIGWSPREGSGVFDPVKESGMKYTFYRMDNRLHIDLADLKRKLDQGNIKIFVIIHYFGHVDPNYNKIIALVRSYGCFILEDEAHALYTDVIDGKSGRQGDAVIYALHKMLPVEKGGALVFNNESVVQQTKRGEDILSSYDLYSIAVRRKANVCFLRKLLADCEGVYPLWEDVEDKETLQTFPVIIEKADRNVLYEVMNNAGFGVVTLYHTLIKAISREEYPESYHLSEKILNLPVHQDIHEEQLSMLVEYLKKSIKELE